MGGFSHVLAQNASLFVGEGWKKPTTQGQVLFLEEEHWLKLLLCWSIRNLDGFFQSAVLSLPLSSCLRSQLWLNEMLIPQIHSVYSKSCLVKFNSVSGMKTVLHLYTPYSSILSAFLQEFLVMMIPGLFNKTFQIYFWSKVEYAAVLLQINKVFN